MHYFDNVKLKKEVFSLVYGNGVIIFALPKEHRLEGFFVFAAEYEKKHKVYYTIDGFPNWSSSDGSCQTVFYKKDVDFSDMDIQPPNKILSEKQILKYKEKDILEIQCPSGIWRHINETPQNLMKKALKKSKYHLFRKQKSK